MMTNFKITMASLVFVRFLSSPGFEIDLFHMGKNSENFDLVCKKAVFFALIVLFLIYVCSYVSSSRRHWLVCDLSLPGHTHSFLSVIVQPYSIPLLPTRDDHLLLDKLVHDVSAHICSMNSFSMQTRM